MGGLYKGSISIGKNILVSKDDIDSKNTEFGILYLSLDMIYQTETDQEYLFCLVNGRVELSFEDKSCVAERENCFDEEPYVLSLPAGCSVRIKCLSEYAELNYACTQNDMVFNPLFITPGHLLSSEIVDKDVLNGRTVRYKRVFYDWTTHPESCLFCGEIVNFPGSWACYPPHLHDEPEIYHYRFSSSSGYGFSEYGASAYKVCNLDTMCIPGGVLHSQVTIPGCRGYIMWTQRLKSNGVPINYKQIEGGCL